MRTYTQLTQEQRYQIYALKKMGHNQTEIANCLGVNKSTISRGLKRNQGQRGDQPKQAHNQAMNRPRKGQSRILAETWVVIEEKFHLDRSSEQISGWLLKHHQIQVSHEQIYQSIMSDKRVGGFCTNIYAVRRNAPSATVAVTAGVISQSIKHNLAYPDA